MDKGTKVKVNLKEYVLGTHPKEDFWKALSKQPDAVFEVIHTGYR